MAARLSTGRKVVVVVLIVLFAAFLGVAFNIDAIVEAFKQGRDKAFYTSMGESCVRSATQSVQAKGADVAALKPKIVAYCDCVVQEAKNRFPAGEAASLDMNSAETQSKLTDLAQACAGKLTQ